MTTIKSYTDLEQSKKLAKILPLESADGFHAPDAGVIIAEPYITVLNGEKNIPAYKRAVPCWSLAALLDVLPEINGIPLTLEKVKAEDGYEGYYYHIEYKNKILIPYSKNPVDACVEMILKLHELNLL